MILLDYFGDMARIYAARRIGVCVLKMHAALLSPGAAIMNRIFLMLLRACGSA